MLLDCDEGTLAVYVNGKKRGTMMRPGMQFDNGDIIPRIRGAMRWAVDVAANVTVTVTGPLPLPDDA